jgi:HEPN domain-containing protein
MLQGGHSLIKLCKKASEFDSEFRSYIKDCAFLNGYYIETRYPAEDPLIAEKDDVEEGMQITLNILNSINKKIS